eukprot:1381477-Pleurochrysis_carterae.AAC.5
MNSDSGESEAVVQASTASIMAVHCDGTSTLTLSLEDPLLLPCLWTPYFEELCKVAWRWARLAAIGSVWTEEVGPCAQVLGLASLSYLKGVLASARTQTSSGRARVQFLLCA